MTLTHAINQAADQARSFGTWIRNATPLRAGAGRPHAYEISISSELTARQRLDDLLSFYSRYEDLVEAICDAAQYGPGNKLESRYQENRRWLNDNYSSLRPFLLAYLQHDEIDESRVMEMHHTDAFEALFAAPTLQDMLRWDDGGMISRILRTRTALNAYAIHLRELGRAV